MYVFCCGLVAVALYTSPNVEVYGMINLLVGAAIREIGGR